MDESEGSLVCSPGSIIVVCDANRCRKDWFTALVAASNRSMEAEAKPIPRKSLAWPGEN